MNKKNLAKVTGTSAAAFLIAGTTVFTAFAAMPEGTVVIGNKAFSLDYANLAANVEEIRAAIIAGDGIYVKAPNGTWYQNSGAVLADTSVIPAVEYKAADGKVTKYEAKDGNVVTADIKVDSVKAVSSKKLEVKFTKAVDTTKAVLTVKRDGVKSNVTATTWNADKTVATIELTSKISKAEYAVEVTGVTTTALTGSVKAEDERVAKIQVLSTEVPLSDVDADTNKDDLAVPYKVENQYGEDITKVTSLVASNGVVDPINGVVKFTGNYDTVTNKTVAFTLINVDSNVSTSAVVTAVASVKESNVEILGIYNKDGKTLTETTDLVKDKFFVEIKVTDQYGNLVKAPTAASLILSETNNTIVDIDDSITAGQPELDTTTVDGKVLIAIKAPGAGVKAGETTVTLISRNTGKSASTVVKVAEGIRANTVTLGQPELVAAGEDALIPVTVLDKQGNEIKDLDILNNAVRGIGLEAGNTLVLKDNVVYVKVPGVTVGPKVAMVTVKPTQKIVTVNYTVKDAAVPTVIAGLDSKIQTSISAGLSQDIKGEDLVVEDQYGRVMTDDKVKTWLDATAGNSIVISSVYDALTDKSPFTVVSNIAGDAGDDGKNVVTGSLEKFTLAAKTTANLNASEKLTFALSADNGTTINAASAKDVVFSKVGITDFASYELAAPATIFNDVDTYSFKVYGVKADGSKSLLEQSQYNVIAPAGFTFSGTNNNTFALTAPLGTIDDNVTTTTVPQTKEFTFKVVIGDTAATTLTKVVTVSAEARKVVDFKITSNGLSTGTALSKLVYEASRGANDADIIDLAATTPAAINVGLLDAATLEQNIYYIDQYGEETTTPVAGSVYLTFANVVDKDTTTQAVVTSNGSTVALVDKLEAGDTLKVTVTIGAITKTYDVEVK